MKKGAVTFLPFVSVPIGGGHLVQPLQRPAMWRLASSCSKYLGFHCSTLALRIDGPSRLDSWFRHWLAALEVSAFSQLKL
uniref:Uncharacterized protein n=1 Tax=Ixodes ricinus TaxID=34613 RepID=A0A6B0TVQ6_IXORI